MIVLGAALVLTSVYVITDGNGSPLQGNQVSTSCFNVQVPNGTSPSGFTGQIRCTSSPYYDSSTIWYNLAFWIPFVGSMVYAMPGWIEPEKRNVVTSLSRILKGSVLAGTLLFLTFGLDNLSAGYPELFNGHSPLNPFLSYNPLCNSITFGVVTCVQVNPVSYFIDYLFWIGIAALVALALSKLFVSTKTIPRFERVKEQEGQSVSSL